MKYLKIDPFSALIRYVNITLFAWSQAGDLAGKASFIQEEERGIV